MFSGIHIIVCVKTVKPGALPVVLTGSYLQTIDPAIRLQHVQPHFAEHLEYLAYDLLKYGNLECHSYRVPLPGPSLSHTIPDTKT